jgi:hypothetical protein
VRVLVLVGALVGGCSCLEDAWRWIRLSAGVESSDSFLHTVFELLLVCTH